MDNLLDSRDHTEVTNKELHVKKYYSVNNLPLLKKYAEVTNKELHIEKYYSIEDTYKIRFDKEDESNFEPTEVYYGLEIKPFVFIWFVQNYFSHFYNMNNGVKQKGMRRYLTWSFKEQENIKKALDLLN